MKLVCFTHIWSDKKSIEFPGSENLPRLQLSIWVLVGLRFQDFPKNSDVMIHDPPKNPPEAESFLKPPQNNEKPEQPGQNSRDMGVSENNGTPKSSILIGFSIINNPFWGYPYFWKHPYGCCTLLVASIESSGDELWIVDDLTWFCSDDFNRLHHATCWTDS